ncbi:8-amino-7-oxononanoate synthase [Dendrosporobacter sp. 1207_IL3150]|uniref:8-amino-7-oxononanoate synthase n=1 Tax=Dendrosporobacter sp. 1207_IL3150 TaxID=3084054 RepID=UPI002FDACB0F
MEFLKKYLSEVKKLDLYRQTNTYIPTDATHVKFENKTFLMLASNNYLGLTHHACVKQAAIDAVQMYGTGSGGARLTTGSHPLYAELEQEIARFKGTEAALVFNTGYMANIGVISALMNSQDVIFSDELNHASIIDGCRLSKATTVVFRHSDINHLEDLLAKTTCHGRKLIVVDGVFSMDGDIAPLKDIVELAEKYDAMVMVDDAHATGVLGNGRGTAAHFGLKDRVHIQMGTLSKALGSEGGYVAGSRCLIEYLINKARSYIFSTALAPATIAAAKAALKVVADNPEIVDRLNQNADIMRSGLRVAGLKVDTGETPIIPVIVGDAGAAVELAKELRNEGLIIAAIRPPTVPVGESRLRITVSAAHKPEELEQATMKIAAAAQRLGLLRGER